MNQYMYMERGIGWAVSLLLIASTFLIEKIPPKFTEFYEGDIALSYSVHDTVPYRYVIITCYIVPIILLCLFILKKRPRFMLEWIHDAAFLACRTFATNEVLICMLKNFIGRPRPCFFQLCGYENTTSISSSGQLITTYGTFGALGDVSKCLGSKSNIYAAFRSFPSGHSATATSGAMITILFLFRFIQANFVMTPYRMRAMKVVLSVPLIFWVCFILGSRIFDYRHRPEDVIGGVVFGSLTALYVWVLHYPSKVSTNQKNSVTLFDSSSKEKEYTKVVVVSIVS